MRPQPQVGVVAHDTVWFSTRVVKRESFCTRCDKIDTLDGIYRGMVQYTQEKTHIEDVALFLLYLL